MPILVKIKPTYVSSNFKSLPFPEACFLTYLR